MSSKDKLIDRFLNIPRDFTWDEMKRLLSILGFTHDNKGKTSGSRIIFKGDNNKPIILHKPHPGNIVKTYVIRQVKDYLSKEGIL